MNKKIIKDGTKVRAYIGNSDLGVTIDGYYKGWYKVKLGTVIFSIRRKQIYNILLN